jgi:ubiquinone/menaquinone biosynthesis C-methylase UbiE
MDITGKEYYDYAVSRGIQYEFYGDWQKSYAKMVIAVSNILEFVSNNYKGSLMLDVGTACGANLKAFKDLKVFEKYVGVDINQYMIELGRKTYGFTENELITLDISNNSLPLETESVSFIHCSQVLEHIESEKVKFIVEEWRRVLHPSGYVFITVPTVTPKEKKEQNDVTHINMQTMIWWRNQLKKHFNIDNEVTARFKEDVHSPDNSDKNFYHYYNQVWTIFQLQK